MQEDHLNFALNQIILWNFMELKSGADRIMSYKTDRKEARNLFNGTSFIIYVLCAVLLLTTLCPIRAFAEEPEQKVVRVGYVSALNYEEGGEGEYKRGSGYEYLQQISYLTGWKYEYVYGSFKECYDMLTKGEIDLFGNVSYTPERAEQIDYSSYPQGKDVYLLYTSRDRTDLSTGDIQKLNGCNIGVTQGSYQEGLLKTWLQDNNVKAKVMEYNGYDPIMSAMDTGEIDAFVTPDLSINYNYVSIMNIGFSEYYFAVSKSRPDILKELNDALYEIQNTEQDYNSQLISRYYNRMTSALLLNEKEKSWLDAHDNSIRIGYLRDDLPLCGEENSKMIGIMQTVAETVESEFNINIETVPYDDMDQMKRALKTDEIDVAGPVISDFYLAEQDNSVLSSAIMDSTPLVVYKGGDADSSLKVIAVSDSSVFDRGIIGVLFPEAEILQCGSQEECLQAVVDGKAGSTIVLSSRLNILRSVPAMDRLSFAEMSRRLDICFTATKENRRAASIINKGIILSSEVLNGVVLSQHSVADRHVSIKDFLSQYAPIIVLLACLIIITMGFLIYRLSVSQKKLVVALNEAHSANVAKTAFLSNMSHDIRTPMNAIMGFADIAMKQKPDSQIRKCLEHIEESSDHLLALINNVLDISRIESGKIKYDPTPVNISKVTDSVINIMNGFLVNRDLTFNAEKNIPEDLYVLADAVRVQEILVNILGNAVKFTEDGGVITFRAEQTEGADVQHVVVHYSISDTGIGMSEEFQEHIFDEFTQENSGARTSYLGNGLGLAITKRYVTLMGGRISVESKRGKGSKFTVELPLELTEECETEDINVSVGSSDLTGVRILLAEDNDLNAEIATVLLEEYGVAVTRAVDGREAVNIFSDAPEGSFDLILMDIMMPRMNGYEATKAIRSLPDRADSCTIPIIAMTANAFVEDVQASLDAGMNAHLSKPIVMDEVVKVIAMNLNN